MGVELFFIISGFVIYMTIDRTDTLRAFAISRFARLYPAFIACLIVTVSVSYVVKTYAWPDWPFPIFSSLVLANLTMAPKLFHRWFVDPSYWSLLYELDFYVLAAVVTYACGWRAPERMALGWLIITTAERVSGLAGRMPLLEQLTAGNYAYLFIIGIMLYRHFAGQATALTYLVLGLAAVSTLVGSSSIPDTVPQSIHPVLIFAFGLLVWVATCHSVPILQGGILPFLGDISYPLYLVHQVAGYPVIRWLLGVGVPFIITLIITTCMAIAAAWCISLTIERPGRRLLRTWLGSPPTRRADTPRLPRGAN